jgi:hypothetical protein
LGFAVTSQKVQVANPGVSNLFENQGFNKFITFKQ